MNNNYEKWELSMSMEDIRELEEAERKVILNEQLIQAYYDGKLTRAQKRVTKLLIKRRRRLLGHK